MADQFQLDKGHGGAVTQLNTAGPGFGIQHIAEGGFRDAEGVKATQLGVDLRPGQLFEARQNLLAHHLFELERHARGEEELALATSHHKAAGGADRVVEDFAPLWQPGLFGIALCHGAATAGVARFDGSEPVGEKGKRLGKGFSGCLSGEVVGSGPESATHQHHLGAAGTLLQHRFQVGEVVPYRQATAHLPALFQQQSAEPGRVGIHHQTRHNFVSGTDDLDTHGRLLGLNGWQRLASGQHNQALLCSK